MSKSTPKGTVLYHVLLDDAGNSWLHAPGSDFLFAYIDASLDADVQKEMRDAYHDALKMSSTIKNAIKTTSGQDILNGLYLLNDEAMVKAMNSIPGMGLTGADKKNKSGSGTAVSINSEFFAAILGGISGDIAPILDYLTTQMGDVIAQVSKSSVTENFGIVVGLISLMPVLDEVVTSFQYVYSDSTTSKWLVDVTCVSTEGYDYNYNYTVANYNYIDPAAVKAVS